MNNGDIHLNWWRREFKKKQDNVSPVKKNT